MCTTLTLSQEVIMDLYDFNHNQNRWANEGLHHWAGSLKRKALQLIYSLAFLCLLRSDKVLKLRFEHISLETEGDLSCIKVTLPFQKTHKFGGVHISPSPICPRLTMSWQRSSCLSYGSFTSQRPISALSACSPSTFTRPRSLQASSSVRSVLTTGCLRTIKPW